ncbi:MAG: hypothetical protein PWQ39_1693 [Thermacetogenium sp.]|nr:hypothetical protein [Thermacetogenium sp.]
MNILSVDWDYFIGLSEKDDLLIQYLWKEYADRLLAKKFGLSVNNLWRALYEFMPELHQVKFMAAEYKALLKLLDKQPLGTPCMVAPEHTDAYYFIRQYKKWRPDVYNIDYHHDVYTHALHSLNCGNWLLHLKREKAIRNIYWINGSKKSCPQCLTKMPKIKEIGNVEFSCIFLCKSNSFSLPKYDHKFLELLGYLKSRFDVSITGNIQKDRWSRIAV